MPTIGSVIKEYRLKAGWTQQQLGEMIGLENLQQMRIGHWEQGVRVPSASYLLRIMCALHIPPEAFDEYK